MRGIEDVDGPGEGEVLLKKVLPTPVGLVIFGLIGPSELPLLSNRDESMVLVRVREMLKVLATLAIDVLARIELALSPSVPLLIGGK